MKNTLSRRLLLPLTLLTIAYSPLRAQTALSTDALRCEQQADPVGLETAAPRFSWQIASQSRGCIQKAYRIIVADTPQAAESGRGTMWDSGRMSGEQSLLVPYAGKPLEASRTYYWRVRVWDRDGKSSAWSPVARFSTGLSGREGWNDAKWIALENDIDSLTIINGTADTGPENPILSRKKIGFYKLPLLRREFAVDKPVRRATAYVCGLGQFEMFLNGKKVGNHFLDPAWTKFDKEAQYVPFDVTDCLVRGANAVGVMLGNGFYNIPRERYSKFVGSYGAPKMILKLLVEYEDGTRQTLVSDESWKAAAGPVTFSSIYGGEDYDASLAQTGWAEAGFDDGLWNKAVLTQFGSPLYAQQTTPLEIRQRIPTVRKFRNHRGNYLYDLGQNASGIVSLKVLSNGRHTIRMFPGELNNPDSTVSQRSSGGPVFFSYTAEGTGQTESWQPRFMYYGFRYVEVEGAVPQGEPNPNGLPEIVELTGLHTTNSAEPVGSFRCSNPLFNQIYSLIDWAIRSNFSSVFTDCPHREKLGWLEQSHLVSPSVHYGYDISRAFPKIIGDMATAQHDDGMIPTIAPQYTVFAGGFLDTPEWGSAFILLPYYIYQWYGDDRPMRENYDRMTAYVNYLSSKADGHIVAYGLGDWCDLGPEEPAYAQLTSNALSATAMYYYDICTMRRIAEHFGRKDDAAKYEALGAEVKKAFNDRFFDPKTLKYDRNSQAANAMALYMDLVEPQYKQVVLQNLIDDIRGRGNAVTAGDIGFRYVVQTLQDNGASDVLFDMNSRYDVPGYGYQIAKGETALAESWQSRDYLSHNHCMLGHLYSWLFSGLGGISQAPGSVAYKDIVIDPQIVGDIRSASASFRSPYGLIRSEWTDTASQFSQTAEIPANTSAWIYLPAPDAKAVTESGQPIAGRKDITIDRSEDGRLRLHVGSGLYRFCVEK